MKITMKNCQGIHDCELDLPANSIVEFLGPNSNGKSTLSRFIKHICQCDLHVAENRKTLITRQEEQAEFVIESDNKTALIVIIHKELQKSFMAFSPNTDISDNMLVRAIGDRDACAKLVHRFGFRTYAKGEICLNLAPTYGAIPLVNTSGKVNFEIVDDLSKDAVADEFITSYKNYTRPMFVRKMRALKEKRAELEKKTETNLYPDWEFCKDFAERNKGLADALSRVVLMDKVDYSRPLAYHAVVMTPVKYSRPSARIYENIPNMKADLLEIIEINNKRCPTCGHQYLEE